jgi:cell wall-associated NlpC family hydrolase
LNLRSNRVRRSVAIAVVGLTAGLLLAPGNAQGDTIESKRAEAARLQSAIDENGRRTSALSEQINGAQYKLDQAQAQIAEAQARIDAAKAESNRLEDLLAKRAVQIYKGAGNTSPLDAVDVGNVNEIAARRKYASAASNHDNALVDELTRAREALAVQKAQQEEIKEAAQSERDSLAAARQEIEAANARQHELLSQVKGELAALVRQEAERREAAARARSAQLTAARSSSVGSSRDTGSDPGNYPAPSGGAAAAVAFARAQIGKPYQYAASGPDTYDCSGLTMMAWRAGGVSMPHYSGAQYSMFPRVPMSALQPGDLVFWGPGGSNHVAMYVGGGTLITAPRTGDVVKYSPIYGSPIGAVRPG